MTDDTVSRVPRATGQWAKVPLDMVTELARKPDAVVLYAFISGRYGGLPGIWPSVASLVSGLPGWSETRVHETIRVLVKHGWIDVEYRPRRSNVYRLRGAGSDTSRGAGSRTLSREKKPARKDKDLKGRPDLSDLL